MRKVMRIFVFMVCIVVLTSVMSRAADYGPYYIFLAGHCDVYEVYVTPELLLYGTEIGCNSGNILSGYLLEDMALITNCKEGYMQIFQYNFNFQVVGYANFGNSLSAPVQLGAWSLGSAPAARSANSEEALPSIADALSRSLP